MPSVKSPSKIAVECQKAAEPGGAGTKKRRLGDWGRDRFCWRVVPTQENMGR